ncbi:MAG: hypothetical protein HPY51_02965 [Candidatus Omnitrophica bacterium]|nr:hypothetical protein [Candidatus Omnitrophota bacterium]
MRRYFYILWIFVLLAGIAIPTVHAQKVVSTPVDLSAFWNADGWYHYDPSNPNLDPGVPSPHPDAGGGQWGLDGMTGGARIRINTLPPNVIPGQVNVTEDGEVAFLLPKMEIGDLDVYYPAGDTIPVPPGKYKYLYLACMSGNGNWPGSESDWAPIVDINTKQVIDPRHEVNSFKPIYQEGEGNWIYIGTVNDWFWKVPEWVAPASGDPNEIVVDWLTYDGHVDDILYLWDYVGMSNHDYGQYHYVNGAGNYFVYNIPIPAGLTKATLWTEMWGNVKLSYSTDDITYTELYNSATMDQVYTAPAGNIDGYFPNRELRSFDLAPILSAGNVTNLFLKFEDAAPDNAPGQANNPWGARCRSLGIFKGDVVRSSLGARLWPGLVRTDGNSPQGGLILIKKKYFLDNTKTLTALVMPNNIPRSDPYLSIFAITLGNDPTAVEDYMLH